MSTLNLPAWFDALECELSLVPDTRGFQGPFGGPTEVQDLIGDRWRMRLTMPDGDFSWGGRTGALFNRLRGGANWLRLHDFARPVPRGTARGGMTLSAAVLQGASSLSLGGIRHRNLLQGGSFELDTSADGLANGWTVYQSGTVGTVTKALLTGPAIGGSFGAKYQRVASSGLNGRIGVYQQGIPVTAGQAYTLQVEVGATAAVSVEITIQWLSGGGTFISESPASFPSTLALRAVTGTAPAGAATASVYVLGYIASGMSVVLDVDNAQLEVGSTATAYAGLATLLSGDKLGHNGEQLFEVADDASANELGEVTVTITNRARKAIASGQAIVWDKPQIPWQLIDNRGVPTTYTRGRARGQQVEFVEAWLA